MGKGKPRHDPKKPQNRYGSKCWNYEEVGGNSFCEMLCITNGNPTKICKGNRHNCCKVKYHDMAQKNGKQYNDYWKHQEEKDKVR